MSASNYKLEDFYLVYKNDLERYIKGIKRQFRKIALDTGAKDIDVIVSDNPTSVCYIEGKHELKLYINFNDICDTYAINNGTSSLFDIFCIYCTHEYMHVLMGHLTKKEINKFNSVACGEDLLKYSYSYNILYIQREECNPSYDDQALMNIACDLEINELINAPKPLLRPGNYRLPTGLTAIDYYMILSYCKYFGTEGFQDKRVGYMYEYFSKFSDVGQLIEFSNNLDTPDMIYDMNHEDSGFGNNESIIDETCAFNTFEEMKEKCRYDNLPGKLNNFIDKLNLSQTGIWKEFKDILNIIKKRETNMKLSYVGYTPDWCKFNNRKASTGLIYPGRTEVEGGFISKFAPKSTIFIDVSGSMSEYLEPLYTFAYLAMSQMDVIIALYDTEVIKVFNGKKELEILQNDFAFGGGTSLLDSINDYIQKYEDPKHVYAITDGYDYTISKVKEKFDSMIWKISGNTIKEINDASRYY